MKTKNAKIPTTYRVPSSKYWAQYWYRCPVGLIATLQLIMVFIALSMEIGNSEVDLYRSNIYSGFWSFPFTISATIATYICVCTASTLTKAILALILQIISIVVMFIVIGFLMAFIGSNYTLCLGFQCYQSSSTSLSLSSYNTFKQGFITCELASSIIYIVLSIIYIILFIRCYRKLPSMNQIVRISPVKSPIEKRKSSKLTSSSISFNGAQKVCPNCKKTSPYIPTGNIIECPICKYQSRLVEHTEQF